MKKFIYGILSVAMVSLLMLGCGGGGEKKAAAPAANAGKKVVIKVGATPVPHAELLNFVKPQLEK
ncbi:MAG: methionine ABC transporter substrate-binding protein, partial [Succiniclasticum sp.]